MRIAGVLEEGLVAAQEAGLAVLPEHPLGDVVQDQLQHLLRGAHLLLGLLALGDVLDEGEMVLLAAELKVVDRDLDREDPPVLGAVAGSRCAWCLGAGIRPNAPPSARPGSSGSISVTDRRRSSSRL